MKPLTAAILVVGLFGAPVKGIEFERVLLPIVLLSFGIPGAYGSLWTTEIVGRNDADVSVIVQGWQHPSSCGGIPECPNYEIAAHSWFRVTGGGPDGSYPGAFQFVSKPGNDRGSFNLRVFDKSRQSLSWGTEIPVVRERDVRTGTVVLPNVPTDSRFRTMLRVYDFDGALNHTVLVRFYADQDVLAETRLTLSHLGEVTGDIPGYAQIGNFTDTFPQLSAFTRLRIEITPISEGVRFGAFISVTNNETQHVTTITPH
jgi:hypothetical protein